jgi:hypothetical protein
MHIQTGTIGEHHVHGAPPGERRVGRIPLWSDSPLRGRLPVGSWQHFLVPMGIQVKLTCGLVAPLHHRPRGQPSMPHSTSRSWHGVAGQHFHPSWCSAACAPGHRLLA